MGSFLKLIEQIKSRRIFRILYWTAKIMLGLGFVLSGLRKLPGIKFTALPIENPVGLFFEGMYASGFYWNFIGYYQIIVGLLLIGPWWKRLTPILIAPVTVSIFLVSVSLHMRGTPVITAMMLLGNLYLLLWHSDSYRPLFKRV